MCHTLIVLGLTQNPSLHLCMGFLPTIVYTEQKYKRNMQQFLLVTVQLRKSIEIYLNGSNIWIPHDWAGAQP